MVVKVCGMTWKLHLLHIALFFGDCRGQIRTTVKPKNILEELHIPQPEELSPKSNGSDLPPPDQTPDFRLEEPAWEAHSWSFWAEDNRPYRFSPYFKQLVRWDASRYYPQASAKYVGCYCTTVYKRLTMLAGCAVITSRHILTTATSTELILQHHRNDPEIGDILGAWYDYDGDVYNSSLYMKPARIHYHPSYIRPHQVNISHPLPFVYDLSVWAATHKFYGNYFYTSKTVICARGGPHWFEYITSTPRYWDVALIVGFQYVKSQRKIPAPWFRYVTRSRKHTVPCPKTEWNWYHCLPGPVWGKYGVESGAAWHRALERRYWVYDGLIGMCAFSMQLRSEAITHYFTVLNTHPVLDFLYNAYMGRLPYEYLDHRYYDTQWRAPMTKPWVYVPWFYNYDFGKETYDEYGYKEFPWYKK